jgi:pyruvate/2-oxoglutarate dehydrogenase complex dihydrolipoamide acyltransferase (E2) component
MADVILEPMAEGMETATVQCWFYEEGDAVSEGDDLAEVVSEEGVFRVAAPSSGVIQEVFFGEGDTVGVGDVLCEIEDE